MRRIAVIPTSRKEIMPLKKRKRSPELETFTLLNPNFLLPAEDNHVETNQEKSFSEGNISGNLQNEE